EALHTETTVPVSRARSVKTPSSAVASAGSVATKPANVAPATTSWAQGPHGMRTAPPMSSVTSAMARRGSADARLVAVHLHGERRQEENGDRQTDAPAGGGAAEEGGDQAGARLEAVPQGRCGPAARVGGDLEQDRAADEDEEEHCRERHARAEEAVGLGVIGRQPGLVARSRLPHVPLALCHALPSAGAGVSLNAPRGLAAPGAPGIVRG